MKAKAKPGEVVKKVFFSSRTTTRFSTVDSVYQTCPSIMVTVDPPCLAVLTQLLGIKKVLSKVVLRSRPLWG